MSQKGEESTDGNVPSIQIGNHCETEPDGEGDHPELLEGENERNRRGQQDRQIAQQEEEETDEETEDSGSENDTGPAETAKDRQRQRREERQKARKERQRKRQEERQNARKEKKDREREKENQQFEIIRNEKLQGETILDVGEEDMPIEGVEIQEFKITPYVNDSNNRDDLTFSYDYKEVIHKSIMFYEAQRSGMLPSNNRIEWRGDSCLNDLGQNGEDLTGGWFDAGDHIKFGLPMAWSTTVLAWGLIQYKEVYSEIGELETMLDCIKWPADYFIKCHTKENEFYYQVGDPHTDHKRWGPPETLDLPRPSFKVDEQTPGSDVVGETAAALAACAIVFQDKDDSYSKKLLDHSMQLYEFASTFVGKYPSAGYYDVQPSVGNKLAWAAAWLYYATGSKAYLSDAETYYADYNLKARGYCFGWDNSNPGMQLLMYLLTGEAKYKRDFTKYLDCWMPNNKLPYTPKGLVYRSEWGPLRYAASNSFLAMLAADYGINREKYIDFAMKQIHYILGDTGRSFVCGFGVNPPQSPHHRASSTSISAGRAELRKLFRKENPNPHILYGAVVGGPDINDGYVDDRGNYIMNEVATDYNAGFQSAVAGLKLLQMKTTT